MFIVQWQRLVSISPLSWQFVTLYQRESALAGLYSSNNGISGITYLSFYDKALKCVILNIEVFIIHSLQ